MGLRASVIVPVYNGEATIEECLRSLTGQTVPPGDYEVLVVDDGSTDRTRFLVQGWGSKAGLPRVRLLSQDQRGPAAARNSGVREAKGDIILFTDSDCFPEPDWLERMLAPFQDPEVAGAKGVYRSAQREWVARFVQLEYESKYRRMARFRWIDFVDTYSAAFRREVFLAAGGYDTAYRKPSVEDQEFSFRLAARGCRMVFVPEAVVGHLHAASLRAYGRKKFRIGFYKALLLARHPERTAGDTHTPRSLQAQVGLVVLLPPAVLLASLGWLPWWPAAALGAAYLATMAPFMGAVFHRDPVIALSAPIMITLRSVALGMGLLAGFGRFGPPGRKAGKAEASVK